MFGCSDEEITAIREGRFEGFAPPEVALLRMSDALADTPANVKRCARSMFCAPTSCFVSA